MNLGDYDKYYIQNSEHYLIPKPAFDELFNEMVAWREKSQELKKQVEYLRSGEYLNQLRFERDMLQDVANNGEVSKEDKEFIDMTHRNTELLEENAELKKQLEETEVNYDSEHNMRVYLGTQQTKFIKYLEDYIKDRNEARQMHEMYSESENRLSSQYFILQEILQKYKEIMGDNM